MSILDTISAMREAGIPAEQILAVVENMAKNETEAKASRRAKDAERKRRQRAREVGECHAMSRDVTRTDRDGGGQTVTKEVSPHTPLQENLPLSKENPPKGGQKKGSLLPSDWELPDDWRSWAKSNTPLTAEQISREAATFRDHWHSMPGAKARKADWFATWRNWCRRAEQLAPKSRASPQGDGYLVALKRRRQRENPNRPLPGPVPDEVRLGGCR